MPETRSLVKVPAMQTEATLNQANPVQNTWYTILDTTKNVRLLELVIKVLVADETLEVRFTIDGKVYAGGTIAATAGTTYYAYAAVTNWTGYATSTAMVGQIYSFMEGRSVKIEVRKTTALGAGNLQAWLMYQKW